MMFSASPVARSLVASTLAVLALSACSKSGGGGGGAAPPPAPANGAPIAFGEVTKLTPGEKFEGEIEVKAYNFSDKKIASYAVAVRYTDQAGNALKVGVGTPFEKDVAWTSLSGRKYLCNPKSWCQLEIEAIEVPKTAVKAEVALTSAHALAADGTSFEDRELWQSKGGPAEWPSELK